MATIFASLLIAQLLILAASLSTIKNSSKTTAIPQRLLRNIPLNEEKDLYHSGYVVTAEEIPFIVALDFRGLASCTSKAALARISYGAAERNNTVYSASVSNKYFFQHPAFRWRYAHDIALIKSPYITFSNMVQAVALPKKLLGFSHTWTRSAGWGVHQGSTEGENNELHVVQLQVETNHKCRQEGFGKNFYKNMICGVIPNKETSCRLDSGSPLVLESNVLIGIASFGSDSGCQSNKLLGYTRITYYMDWLTSVMNTNN